jgi:deoxycytidylate deaminase
MIVFQGNDETCQTLRSRIERWRTSGGFRLNDYYDLRWGGAAPEGMELPHIDVHQYLTAPSGEILDGQLQHFGDPNPEETNSVNPKHIALRVEQCLTLAKASNCPRRKFGALLLDPKRNVVLIDGYNGGPRGGGALCGGQRCLRDGLTEQQVQVHGPNGPMDEDPEDAWVVVNGRQVSIQCKDEHGRGFTKAHGWRDEALAERARILAENPPIQPGQRMEIGCHHAEMNVICNAAANGIATAGAWLIVTGEPCLLCAKLVHHAGITKVLCVRGGYVGGDAGPAYLTQHGVEVEYVEGPQDPRSSS